MLGTIEHCSRSRRRIHGQRVAGGPLFCLLVCVAMGTAGAQSDPGTAFEVASVRLSSPGAGFSQRITNTRVDLTKVPLRQVLWIAFRIDSLQSERLSAPDWTRDVRVDIHAIIPESGSRELVPDMLKRLLTERFGLRVSMKPRLTDVYELVVGSGGIRMSEVQAINELDKKLETEPSLSSALSDRILDGIDGPVRVTNTPGGLRTTTERSAYEEIYTSRGTKKLDAVRISMNEFAALLTANVGRPVFDRTKLTGLYQFQIELPLNASALRIVASLGARKADGQPLDAPTGSSALKAVEQLGLRLEPRRIPMDTIVVDSINKAPTEN